MRPHPMRLFGAALVLTLTVAAFSAGPRTVVARGAGTPQASVALTAAEPPPRLSIVAPDVSTPITYGGMSVDGAHVFFNSDFDPDTNVTGGAFRVWDAIAQRYLFVGGGLFQAASADGRSVALRTNYPWVPSDTDGQEDIYLASDAGLRLVSPGTQALVGGGVQFVSDDGEVVVFRTLEGVDPADTDRRLDYYRWDALSNTVRWVSNTPGDVEFRYATPDGSRIFFTDPGFGLWEWSGGSISLRTAGPLRQISRNGDRVYFSTSTALVPEDVDHASDGYVQSSAGYSLLTPGTTTPSEVVGATDDGSRWLINTADPLAVADTDNTDDLYVMTSGGAQAGPWEGTSFGYSADLSVVVARADAALVPEDVDNTADLYRFDTSASTPALLTSPIWDDRATLRAMSPDGRRIVIETLAPLVSESDDSDSRADLYEWFDGVTTLLTPNTPFEQTFMSASIDAKRVAFVSSDPIIAEDSDGSADVYLSDRDLDAPVATIQGPAGGHSGPSATVKLGTAGDDAVWFDCRLDAGGWNPCEPSTTFTGLAIGLHTADVYAFDAAANRSRTYATTTWTVDKPPPVDTVAPTTSAPVHRMMTGSSISSGKTTVRLTWSGDDALSGIARYELAQSTDGGAWMTVSSELTSATFDRPLLPSHSYRFRVRAVDNADNVGAWAYGATFSLTRYSETSSRIHYSGSWTLTTSSVFWGGQAKRTSSAGARASITVTARTIEWVARKGPTYGKAQIYVNGILKATVDLYASAYQNQQVAWTYSWSSSASRTVTIKVLGTSGRPRVDLDAFVTTG